MSTPNFATKLKDKINKLSKNGILKLELINPVNKFEIEETKTHRLYQNPNSREMGTPKFEGNESTKTNSHTFIMKQTVFPILGSNTRRIDVNNHASPRDINTKSASPIGTNRSILDISFPGLKLPPIYASNKNLNRGSKSILKKKQFYDLVNN